MNIHLHPELLERLAQAYALGTLRGRARLRFEALARERSSVRAAALVWQTRLASLTELQVPVAPSPAVWARISNLVQADLQDRAMQDARMAPAASGGWLRNLALWRGAAAAGVVATFVLAFTGLTTRNQMGSEIARLQTELLAQPKVDYVAVLADDKSQASVLVTFDPKSKRLTLQRVGGFQEAADRSLQLWALPDGGAPRSLGVLGGDKLLRLTADERDVSEVPALAISLEPKGGVPGAGGPTGPVLFKGALIQKML